MDFIRFALQYAYSRRKIAGYILLCWLVFAAAFFLNQVSIKILLYMALFGLLPAVFLDFRRLLRVYQKHLTLGDITEMNGSSLERLELQYPPTDSVDDADYQRLLHMALEDEPGEDDTAVNVGVAAYYTRWGRELKAPVSAMERLLLAGDSPMVRRMSNELRRLERYAEMAVVYARLETDPGYNLRRYDLSAFIPKVLEKFDGEIMEKRLTVSFDPTPAMVVTDAKWFMFVLEQLIANALTNTFSGGITIAIEKKPAVTESKNAVPHDADEWQERLEEEEENLSVVPTNGGAAQAVSLMPGDADGWQTVSDGQSANIGPFLLVRDTGTGISPELMEHLFDWKPEDGDGDASQGGLGLYLCRRVCQGLGHSISVASLEGEGTCVRLDLSAGLPAMEDAPDATP